MLTEKEEEQTPYLFSQNIFKTAWESKERRTWQSFNEETEVFLRIPSKEMSQKPCHRSKDLRHRGAGGQQTSVDE